MILGWTTSFKQPLLMPRLMHFRPMYNLKCPLYPLLSCLGNTPLPAKPVSNVSSLVQQVGDEERACARGETDISRKLANPHRALRTTRQSNIRTTALIF